MREKDIEDPVCKYARKRFKMMALKFTSPQRRNVPDRIFLGFTGLMFFIEFKAPGKKATEGQLREHARLIGRGHRVYVCDDVDRGKEIINSEAGWMG